MFNGTQPPLELLKFQYRQIFGLTAAELEAEPADQFFLNLKIYGDIKKKEQLEAQHGGSTN